MVDGCFGAVVGVAKKVKVHCERCGVSFALVNRRQHDRDACDRVLRNKAASAAAVADQPKPLPAVANAAANRVANAVAAVANSSGAKRAMTSTERSARWRTKNRERYNAGMRDYMRRGRAAGRGGPPERGVLGALMCTCTKLWAAKSGGQ